MIINMNYEDIYGNSLTKFWNFCFQYCNKVSLTNNINPKYTEDEYLMAKEEIKELKSNQLNDDMKTSYQELLDSLTPEIKLEVEYNMRLYEEDNIRYVKKSMANKKENESINNNLLNYHLLERKVTFITHCTTSTGAKELFLFQLDDNMQQCLYNMEELYSRVVFEEELYLDDLALYRDNNIFLSVCSHEQLATLYISDNEYEEFIPLNIPHVNPEIVWRHDEYYKKYENNYGAYPIIEQSAFIGGIDGYECLLYLEDMKENESIYEQYKGKLSPNRISFNKVVNTLKQRYTLINIIAKELEEQTERNIIFNTCLIRKLPKNKEMSIDIYLVVEDEKSEALYKEQAAEYELFVDRKSSYFPLFQPECYIKAPIIIGMEYNTEYIWVEGSEKLKEEITLKRGLNEIEIRNKGLLVNYIKAMRKMSIK